jgi:hypothetical protein
VKKFLALAIITLIVIACNREDDLLPVADISEDLKISSTTGIKLETPFVTESVEVNAKIQDSGIYTIRIFDISNRVVSKEDTFLKQGDNIIEINTNILPRSAYRISLSTKEGFTLGVTDFNKL